MRSVRIVGVLAVVLLVAAWSPAPDAWEPTPGGWVSGPVDYVSTVGQEAGGAVDGVLHDDLLYLTSWRSFSIYDVSDPLAPDRLSTTPLVVGLINEAPQTDGEILLISRDAQYLPPTDELPRGGGVLDIYDVTDPANPELISTYESELVGMFQSKRDHLWTCVLDCDYAYGAGGTILDLRDPTAPVKVGDWSEQAPYREGRFHYIEEVSPGFVMTGSLPMHLLDVRQDPTAPSLLATIEPDSNPTAPLVADPEVPNPIANPESLPARLDWPDALDGELAVVTMETPFTGSCTEFSGDVQTFLTSDWQDSGTFEPADSYRITENGTYTDGAPPYNAVGCSAYGLDVHGSFDTTGGPAAVTFFEHGMRLLDVDPDGSISEVGGFLPAAGNSAQPLWLSDEILYVIDLHRGIDILRVEFDEGPEARARGGADSRGAR